MSPIIKFHPILSIKYSDIWSVCMRMHIITKAHIISQKINIKNKVNKMSNKTYYSCLGTKWNRILNLYKMGANRTIKIIEK
jgi:hypothetical protein